MFAGLCVDSDGVSGGRDTLQSVQVLTFRKTLLGLPLSTRGIGNYLALLYFSHLYFPC